MKTSARSFRILATMGGALCALPSLHAVTAGSIDVHGSVSVTASYSDKVNYLGDTDGSMELNLVDVVLNGSHRFENGLRVGAQLYAYKVGDYKDITADWATLDYSVNSAFGIRAGRCKVALGLYNDSQDLDSVRTFASLPFASYPKTLRAITSSVDGLALYGNLSLGKGGSLDYQVHGGWKESIDGDAPLVKGFNNFMTYDHLKVKDPVWGASLFWNTPIEGLRAGISYFESSKNQLQGSIRTAALLTEEYAPLAAMVDYSYGEGAWDYSGLFAGTFVQTTASIDYTVFSVEYTYDKWLFAVEYKTQDITDGVLEAAAFDLLGLGATRSVEDFAEQYYAMVTYQATDKLGIGLYYSEEDLTRKDSSLSSLPQNHSKDWAAALSYAPTDSWVCKLEYHSIKGLSLPVGAGDGNALPASDLRWGYLVLKSTFSF